MKSTFQILFVLLLSGLLFTACQSEKASTDTILFDSFVQEDYINIDLTSNWTAVINADQDDNARNDATIQWKDAQGESYQMPIQLERRGKTRLQQCDFPPLKLIFSKDQMQENELGGGRKLKLVTHCNGDEALVLREYLAYQMYQELTEKSFRAQLVKITYTDVTGQTPAETHWGFILENHHDMAKRLDATIFATQMTKLKSIDGEQYRQLALFQYMIGNTDWNMNLRHNIKLIRSAEHPCPTPIPYDFDYSGLVNAPYANPHPMMPISDVQERYFQWRGKDVTAFDATIQHFLAHKTDLFSLCQNFEHLSTSDREEMTSYLKAFYQKIEGLNRNYNDLVSVLNEHVDLS